MRFGAELIATWLPRRESSGLQDRGVVCTKVLADMMSRGFFWSVRHPGMVSGSWVCVVEYATRTQLRYRPS